MRQRNTTRVRRYRIFFVFAVIAVGTTSVLLNNFWHATTTCIVRSDNPSQGDYADISSSMRCFAPPTRQVKTNIFHPQAFMETGPGKPFLPLYHKQLERTKQRLLKVRFVLYSTLASNTEIYTPHCRPIYYHIHKNGGSTMNIKGMPGVEAYYTPKEQELGSERFFNRTHHILVNAKATATAAAANHTNADRSNVTTMPIFTFLRDPVTRFLSSVGQALKLNKVRPCTSKVPSGDSLGLLECILTTVQEKESFLDEHLEPQAFELYHGMMGLNLSVHVMDLAEMGLVLEYLWNALGGSEHHLVPQPQRRRSSTGLVAGFNLSTAILTRPIIQRICDVYKVDTLLLEQTNVVPSTLCEHHS